MGRKNRSARRLSKTTRAASNALASTTTECAASSEATGPIIEGTGPISEATTRIKASGPSISEPVRVADIASGQTVTPIDLDDGRPTWSDASNGPPSSGRISMTLLPVVSPLVDLRDVHDGEPGDESDSAGLLAERVEHARVKTSIGLGPVVPLRPIAPTAIAESPSSEPEPSRTTPPMITSLPVRRHVDAAREEPPIRAKQWMAIAAAAAVAAGVVVYVRHHTAATEPAVVQMVGEGRPLAAAAIPPVVIETKDEHAAPAKDEAPATEPAPAPMTASAPATHAAETEAPAVTEDSLPMSALLQRAYASVRERDYHRAQQRFRLALAKDPSNVEAMTGLGDLSRRDGDLPTAKTYYERALAKSPAFVPAMLSLADVQWDLGQFNEATQRYGSVSDRLGDRAPARVKERAPKRS